MAAVALYEHIVEVPLLGHHLSTTTTTPRHSSCCFMEPLLKLWTHDIADNNALATAIP